MKKRILLPILLGLMLVGCGGSSGGGDSPSPEPEPTPTPEPVVTKVNISESSLELDLNGNYSFLLTAEVIGENNPSRAINWSSDDEEVASVEDGLVTALKEGTVLIRATSDFDKSKFATCEVNVIDSSIEPVVEYTITYISLDESMEEIPLTGIDTEFSLLPSKAKADEQVFVEAVVESGYIFDFFYFIDDIGDVWDQFDEESDLTSPSFDFIMPDYDFSIALCTYPEEPVAEYGYGFYDDYYGELKWDDSEDLIDKLHNIISKDIHKLSYGGNWATNQGADQAMDDFEMVDVLYSSKNDLKSNTYNAGRGWQREHAFAASLMTGFTSGDVVGSLGRATDFHNLFAASYSGNTSRGNKNFGVADKNAPDGSYQDLGDYSSDSKNFEPADVDKGTVSRAIFYMAVMYNQEEQAKVSTDLVYTPEDAAAHGQTSKTIKFDVTYKPLSIVEEYVPYKKVTYTNWYYHRNQTHVDPETGETIVDVDVDSLIDKYGEGESGYAAYSMDNCQFAIGNLSTLLEWNNYHHVSYGEYQHNAFVSKNSQQNNRNPFVDYPELIDYAFGNKKNFSGDLKYLEPSYLTLNMDEDEIHHYAIESAKREYDVGETFSSDVYSLKAVKNDLTVTNIDFTPSSDVYTFTDEDAQNKTKVLNISTPINRIPLEVKVNAGSINSCSYIYEIKGSSEFKGYTSGEVKNLGGTDWTFSWSNPNGLIGNMNATYGLAFGKGSNTRMNELTIETVDTYDIDALYLKGSCASNETINYHMYVGEQLVKEGSITRNSSTTGPEVVGSSFSSINGRIKIIIDGSGARNGAIYIHTLAYNAI